MSLHAQLSPEAIARLQAQKRNSTISSLLISILAIVLLFIVLGLFLLPKIDTPNANLISYAYQQEDDRPEKIVPKETVQKKPSSPSASVSRVITSATVSDIAVPVPEVEATTPSLDFGESDDFGSGWGSGTGGNGFASIPSTMSKRCSDKDRMKRLKESGGDVKCEKAVVKALDWLQQTQNDNGSWGDQYEAAMTGMALLAYLGHCETPASKKYGKTVEKAIVYLCDIGMKNDGKLTVSKLTGHQWVYEHGICTYALAEAYTLCKAFKVEKKVPDLKKVTQKAGDIVMDGQADSGGWNYRYANSQNAGDNSVGFWQIQAMKACKHTGLWPESKFRRYSRNATDFLKRVQGQNGAIGYRTSHTKSPHLTGGGVLCMQMWDEGNSREAKKGIEWIRENTTFDWKNPKSANLYYHYYNAQAMMNAGGKHWDWYNKLFQDQLVAAQQSDGSWKQKTGHGPINDHMATCLATMTLEVFYRFLPGTGAK
ncbi:MAG: prenyltransferase/squalene oxidase repeat-containing protein [Akkermansiaceae bacterium]|nr:prenyltransferase/squalene oxidase repeat-containing protein [Akkermansiaceae bacterium]